MNELFVDEKAQAGIARLAWDVLQGDVRQLIKSIPEVHCVVTSPPYYQKRFYGNNANEIGNEKCLTDYIDTLVDLFTKIPLHNRGSLWVNIGDKRSSDGDLFMIPEQFAIRMKEKGWKLADSVIWAKMIARTDGTTEGICMVEPAPGRLNGNCYENFYRFVKTNKIQDAWSDTCAVRLPRQEDCIRSHDIRYLPPDLMINNTSIEGRNLGNVWRIQSGKTTLKHYAVFPCELVERPIAMTCPMTVYDDGSFATRIIDMVEYDEGRTGKRTFGKYTLSNENNESGRQDTNKEYVPRKPITKGWSNGKGHTYPGIVLDPFCGSGTTGEVALKLGRSFIGIDIYENFCNMTRQRCKNTISDLQNRQRNSSDLVK